MVLGGVMIYLKHPTQNNHKEVFDMKRIIVGWLMVATLVACLPSSSKGADRQIDVMKVDRVIDADFRDLCKKGSPSEVLAAIKAGANVNCMDMSLEWLDSTPLHMASRFNPNPEVITILAKAGADLNVRNFKGFAPLHFAIDNPNPEIMKALVKAGANVNTRIFDSRGDTPLHWAVEKNPNPEVITVLAQAGADMNARANLYARNKHGSMTPLSLAAWENPNPEVITALLKAGADVNARDEDGTTPLHMAALKNPNPEVITILVKAGADLNARAENGFTPLHEAVIENSNLEVITTLLKAGADPKAEDTIGRIPIDLATYNGKIREITDIDACPALKFLIEASY